MAEMFCKVKSNFSMLQIFNDFFTSKNFISLFAIKPTAVGRASFLKSECKVIRFYFNMQVSRCFFTKYFRRITV